MLVKKLSFWQMEGYIILFLLASLSSSIIGIDIAIILIYINTCILVFQKKLVVFFPVETLFIALYLGIVLLMSIFFQEHTNFILFLRKAFRWGIPFCLAWYMKDYSSKQWRQAFYVLLGFAALIALYGIVQYFTGITILNGGKWYGGYNTWHGYPFLYQGNWYNAFPTISKNTFIQTIWEVRGTFSHHLIFGAVFLSFFLFSVSFAFFNKEKRKLYGIVSVLFFIIIILSYARASWIGLLIGGTILICYKLPKKQRKRSLLLGLSLFIVLIFLIKTKTGTNTLLQFHLGYRLIKAMKIQSNIDRIYMWKAALISIKKHPFFGIGTNNSSSLQAIYDQLSNKYHHIFQNKASVGVHNVYFQIGVEHGIFVLLLWLAWMGTWLWRVKGGIHKAIGIERSILIGTLSMGISFLIVMIFGNNFQSGVEQTLLFTYMGMSWGLLHKLKKKPIDTI